MDLDVSPHLWTIIIKDNDKKKKTKNMTTLLLYIPFVNMYYLQ